MKKPEKKIISAWLIAGLITSAVLAAILTIPVVLQLQFPGLTGFTAIFILLAAVTGVYTFYRYRAWGFEVRDDHLYLEHGVIVKTYSMVPFVRIQHVDTQRSPVDRLLGLSHIVVYTAGSSGADVTIPGLKPEDAVEMQEKLRDVAISSEDRDAV